MGNVVRACFEINLEKRSWTWWLDIWIPTLGRHRDNCDNSEASLGYTVSSQISGNKHNDDRFEETA